VKLTDKREMEGKVVGRDPATDVALVKIEANNLPHVTLADPRDLKVGEWVVAIGSPYGFENSVTAGIVSATGRSLPGDAYIPFIQTDVAVNPGNSGGPLFNLKGEVVGINSQIYSRSGGYQGLSFAIPIDIAQQVATQLKTTGSVTRGWLGVTIQDVNQDLAKAFNLDKPHGALVSALAENGPAKSAGIKEGDVIIAVDGQTIESSGDLARYIGAGAPGRTASLDLIHNGKRTVRTVKLGTLPGSKDVASASNDDTGGAKLNVTVAELGPEQKAELGVDHGVLVQEVKPGAAARAGVQPGDVILQVNGKRVESVSTLRKGLDALAKGQPAALLIKRGDSTLFVPVEPNAEGVG
jgi:serine protease Do